MADKILIFTVGLTDETEGDFAVMSPQQFDNRTDYNLYKQAPELEKASISWRLNMDIPEVVNIVKQWETDIRRPHLSMIHVATNPHPLNKDFASISFGVTVEKLLPDITTTTQTFTIKDLSENLQHKVPWGAISINLEEIFRHNAVHNLSFDIHRARRQNSTEFVKKFNADDKLELPTMFCSNFILQPHKSPKIVEEFYELNNDWLVRFYNEHESELLELGYTKDVMIQLFGNNVLILGTLIENVNTVYNKIKDYPMICRTSLTIEE